MPPKAKTKTRAKTRAKTPRAKTKEYNIFVEQLISGEAVMRARGTVDEAQQLVQHLRDDQGCFVQRLGPYPKRDWIALKIDCPSRAARLRQQRQRPQEQ